MFRHRFDPSSLVAALVFVNVACAYLNEAFGGTLVAFRWAVPGVVAGILVIAALRLLFRSRRREP